MSVDSYIDKLWFQLDTSKFTGFLDAVLLCWQNHFSSTGLLMPPVLSFEVSNFLSDSESSTSLTSYTQYFSYNRWFYGSFPLKTTKTLTIQLNTKTAVFTFLTHFKF